MLLHVVLPYIRCHRMRWQDSGQGLVEYALILVFVAVAVIVMVALFGTSVANVYCNIINAFGSRAATSC